MVDSQVSEVFRTVAYLIVLWLGYVAIGWLLAVYDVPALIWVGTLAATMHLAWAGTAAIAMGMVWVVTLISMAAFVYAIPAYLRSQDGQDWAMSLFKLWGRGIIFVLMLGFANRFLAPWQLKRSHSFWILVGLTWSALGLGAIIYHP
jgi:hypothetical protein